MGARDFPCHGDSATARPDSARSLPRKPEVRGNHRCRGRGAIFEIGRRAAREVSVFLWEFVHVQSPHRQAPLAQHVAGHGALRFAPAQGALRFALATPGFRGREVDRRCVSASISSESLSQSLPKSSRPPDRGDATSIVESLRVRVKLTGRRDTAADLDNTKKSCVLVSYKTLACASWCGGPGLSARGGWHSSRRAKSLQRRTTAALKSRANRLNCSSARARVWAPRRPVP